MWDGRLEVNVNAIDNALLPSNWNRMEENIWNMELNGAHKLNVAEYLEIRCKQMTRAITIDESCRHLFGCLLGNEWREIKLMMGYWELLEGKCKQIEKWCTMEAPIGRNPKCSWKLAEINWKAIGIVVNDAESYYIKENSQTLALFKDLIGNCFLGLNFSSGQNFASLANR